MTAATLTPPQTPFVARPTGYTCSSCRDLLDPSLAALGRHVLCPAPASTHAPARASEQASAHASVSAPAQASAPALSIFSRPTADHPLKAELTQIIRWAATTTPRSVQAHAGPSELGVDCLRRLAYRLTGTPTANTSIDPWFAIIGTATHEWLAIAMDRWQAEADITGRRPYAQRRYLVEERVRITSDQYGVSGTCDLYDSDRASVIDHKVVGTDALKRYRDHGPSQQYRIQVHLYGLGHVLAGRAVREVALAFYPRSGYLDTMHVWAEAFQPAIAAAALNRATQTKQLAAALPPRLIPAAPDPKGCTYCPFWRPGGPADATGCPGHLQATST